MKTLNLDGIWQLKFLDKTYPATVPGLDVLDLIAAGEVPETDNIENDNIYFYISEHNKTYSREFNITKEDLSKEIIELCFDRLDTLAKISVNNKLVANTENIHLSYCFNIKDFVIEGKNTIEVEFKSLRNHIKEKQKELKLPYNAMGTTGHPHIRKASCLFGWDFAPEICPQGISGHCELRLRTLPIISYLKLTQKIKNDFGYINGKIEFSEQVNCGQIKVTVTEPNGNKKEQILDPTNTDKFTFEIESPELWWCNGLGKQPLYTITTEYINNEEIISSVTKRIGFRDIKLDTSKDEYGSNFQFVINGKPIFAKGANYIPTDSLYTRITKEKISELLFECKNANMNMVRVWGGGFYESDDFYDICDELGLLVWQDFGFACCAYPFMKDDFLNNVAYEVIYNTKRLMHHASLALWCGNNEIESISLAWLNRTSFINSTGKFFYEILPNLIKKYDSNTPYHACSPSSGKYMKNINGDKHGDTHIWNVWHGYQYKEYFKKRFTRFASEFGMQSYPNENITPHQKCDLGEERLNYYLSSLFTVPKNAKEKVYLTQIIQLEAMREAAEHFRRNSHRCHGSLYWQLNDCWSSASWSALDWKVGRKALMYGTKHFYENVHISATQNKNQIEVFVSNDLKENFQGNVVVEKVNTLTNEKMLFINTNIDIKELTSSKISTFDVSKIKTNEEVLIMSVYDNNNNLVSENREIFCNNNELELKNAKISPEIFEEDNNKYITISSDEYARYVFIDIPSIKLSDNFFDLSKDEKKIIKIESDNTLSNVSAFSLYDVMKNANTNEDKKTYLKEYFRPMGLANRISRYFDK